MRTVDPIPTLTLPLKGRELFWGADPIAKPHASRLTLHDSHASHLTESSHHRTHAAIDIDSGAGDVAGRIRAEEERRAAEFFRLADTPQRNVRGELPNVVFIGLIGAVRRVAALD